MGYLRIIWLIGLCSKGNTPPSLFPVLRIIGLPVLSTKRIGLSQDIILSLCFEGDIALATFFVVLLVWVFCSEWMDISQPNGMLCPLKGTKVFISLSLMHQATFVSWIVYITWHIPGLYSLYKCGYVIFLFSPSVKPACLMYTVFFHYIYEYLSANIGS